MILTRISDSIPKLKSGRGSVILLALFLVFFISMLMITVEMLQLSDLEMVTNQIKHLEAFYCAEAGIEYSMFWVRVNPFFPAPNFSNTINLSIDCVVAGNPTTRDTSVTIFNSIADPNLPDFYHWVHIYGTGITSNYQRRVYAKVHRIWVGFQPSDRRYLQIRRWREL